MPKALLKQPFDAYSGKTGDVGAPVLYRRGNENIVRTNVRPANPDSVLQTQVRAAFSAASKAFSDITDQNKSTWENLNAQIRRQNVFGQDYPATAKGLYTGVNQYRQLDGQAINDVAPPAVIQLAATDITDLEIEAGGANVLVTWEHSNADGFFFVELTQALPGVTRQPRDTDFASISNDYITAIAARQASPMVITYAVADMKVPVVAGERYGIRITSLSAGYLLGQRFTKVLTAVQL